MGPLGQVALTHPAVSMAARGDEEDLASCAGDGDGTAHDPRTRGVFLAHEVVVVVHVVEKGEETGVSSLERWRGQGD